MNGSSAPEELSRVDIYALSSLLLFSDVGSCEGCMMKDKSCMLTACEFGESLVSGDADPTSGLWLSSCPNSPRRCNEVPSCALSVEGFVPSAFLEGTPRRMLSFSVISSLLRGSVVPIRVRFRVRCVEPYSAREVRRASPIS
jgi:hypothetical protein